MSHTSRPRWRLAPGVSPGTWDYLRDRDIADKYDAYFIDHPLFAYDERLLAEVFQPPGRIADLGCGTGRLALSLAARGHRAIAVDLSEEMLRVVRQKADELGLPIDLLKANLVELDSLDTASVDYAACLFSTFGMIQGAENREQALGHFARILKPGGLLALHVHNRWRNLFVPDGRRWVIHNTWQAWRGKCPAGDKFYAYRGIPNFYLHVFTRKELKLLVRAAGLRLEQMLPLDANVGGELTRPWLLPNLRASGWMVLARKM